MIPGDRGALDRPETSVAVSGAWIWKLRAIGSEDRHRENIDELTDVSY
jgi:hypothetical protein